MGAVGILLLLLSLMIYAVSSPIIKEFVDIGAASSDEHNDGVTKFFIVIIPIWLLFMIIAVGIYRVTSGGGI